jgi:hypothetical protein
MLVMLLQHGLYCHALSHVVVCLPGPGKTFTAVVGVDSNPQTVGGRGSIVFSVSIGGQQAFRSPMLREGLAGVKLDYWWIDAGWYSCEPEGWPRVGTWEPDPIRYPKGLKEVADYVHGKGMKRAYWSPLLNGPRRSSCCTRFKENIRRQ